MLYKNISYSDKTFYGVTFKPGESKEVPGYISSKLMLLVKEPEKETKVVPQKKPSSAKPKKEVHKVEEVVEEVKEPEVVPELVEMPSEIVEPTA